MDNVAVQASLCFDETAVADLRTQWQQLISLSVWGALRSQKLGALPRLRKRLLELGENLASLMAARDWIPQPRERVKSALGASIKLRDSLLALERAAQLLHDGDDFAEFESLLLRFRQQLLQLLEHHEPRWAALLDSQYHEPDED